MSITAKQVNELRQKTGAGMMDCKKALVEAEGDFEKAIELLRKKGQKVSASRSDRDATEGAVFAYGNDAGNEAALIELNCETDFVARNDDFQSMGESIVKTAFEKKPANLEELREMEVNGQKVSDMLTDAMGRIGEKIDVSRYERVTADRVVTYIHPGARVGVLVGFKNTDGVEIEQVGKDVAMQIAAMRPIAIDQDGVDQTVADKEFQLGREKALAEGKPEHIVDKIAQGYLSKFYKENTLLNQEYVKDTSKTIAQFLKEQKPDLKVSAFQRVQLGEN